MTERPWYGLAQDLARAGAIPISFDQETFRLAGRPPMQREPVGGWSASDSSGGIFRRVRWVGSDAALPTIQSAVPIYSRDSLKVLSADERVYSWAGVKAKPDVVLGLGADRLVVEYKTKAAERWPLNPDNWQYRVSLQDCLQGLIGGLCVAQSERRVTACVLRYPGAMVLVWADREVLDDIYATIGAARNLLLIGKGQALDASSLARVCALRLEKRGLVRWPRAPQRVVGVRAHQRFMHSVRGASAL
jgi:hypothetical protein